MTFCKTKGWFKFVKAPLIIFVKSSILDISQGSATSFVDYIINPIDFILKTPLSTAQKMETADLVTFTEEIFNEKLHFLCSGATISDTIDFNLYFKSRKYILNNIS